MLDLNHQSIMGEINHLIDQAIVTDRSKEKPRDYLGGSRLGVSCSRALQYEFFNTPRDEGKDFSGKTYRIFQVGHVMEDMIIQWFRMAGFDLRNQKPDGKQFGFSIADGQIAGHIDGVFFQVGHVMEDIAVQWFRGAGFDLRNQKPDGKQFGFSIAGGQIAGHIDGVFCGGPDTLRYPCLWECKTMNHKKWNQVSKEKLRKANPVYFAQVQIYMAYMDLTDNPAIFTAINKDTQDLYHEAIPFDPEHSQKISDKGANIIGACRAGEMLPRIATSPDFFECKYCSWSSRCWNQP